RRADGRIARGRNRSAAGARISLPNRAMSIATKTGDAGETSLMYGRRVGKTNAQVDAYGCVDELNAALGLARAASTDPLLTEQILLAQKELITVMGELATTPEDLDRYV